MKETKLTPYDLMDDMTDLITGICCSVVDSLLVLEGVGPNIIQFTLEPKWLYPVLRKHLGMEPEGLDAIIYIQWHTDFPNLRWNGCSCKVSYHMRYKGGYLVSGIDIDPNRGSGSRLTAPSFKTRLKQAILQNTSNPIIREVEDDE